MSYARKETVSITVSAGGSATAYTGLFTGQVINVIYTADGSTPYDNTVDFTISGEDSGINIWTESNLAASEVHSPVQPATLNTGVDSTIVQNPVYVVNERIKIVLAQGGNAKTGTFTFIVA